MHTVKINYMWLDFHATCAMLQISVYKTVRKSYIFFFSTGSLKCMIVTRMHTLRLACLVLYIRYVPLLVLMFYYL